MTHELIMQRCFQLARMGLGKVAPNPMVGSVIVHDGRIIGEGYHQQFGGPHAEINAIKSVTDSSLLKSSTLYVNLEPCSHYGKTPPCADLIIEKQIPKVVISNTDPNPLVAGTGIKKLKDAGAEVITDILKEEGVEVNKRFFTFYTKHRPYIILKWAQSADGFFTKKSDEQHWITGELSKKMVHKWRSEESGILVGKNTALTDNPQLNNRYFDAELQPVRIVIDKNMELPNRLNVFDNSLKTIVFNSKQDDEMVNTTWIKIPFENAPEEITGSLFDLNIQSIIIEGGAKTLAAFINQNLWDEARVFTGNVTFEAGIPAPELKGNIFSFELIGKDNLTIYTNPLSQFSNLPII
jgi:diaminohydroxyphosphoribosylaminopyrimidine deaminase / 5-amino-6-(5-phosphoribosylamino)uracil reductase